MPEQLDNGGQERRRLARTGASLRTIASVVVLLVALPIVALLWWSAEELQVAARQDTVAHAQAMADGVARRHAQLVAEVRSMLTVTAQLPRLVDEPAYCTALMQRLLASDQAFANLGVIATDGRVLCSALPFRDGLNLSDRSYFRRALETRSFAAGTYQTGRITGVPGINFGFPVTGADGEVVGVVFAAIGSQWLAELTDPAALPGGATLALLDHELHELLRHPAQAPDGLVMPVPQAALAALIQRQPLGGSIPMQAAGAADPSRHYTYLRLGGDVVYDAPYLVLGWPQDALATSLTAIARRQPLVVFGALLLLAALFWLLVNAVVMEPVRQLAAAASRLARGEQGVRLPAGGRVAELFAMSSAFNHMADRIDGAMRAYAVLSSGNRILLREQDERSLLEAMCRVGVEVGGYRCAGVVYVTETGIETMARAGDDGGFAAYLQAHWDTALAHQTPTARAIASGEAVVMKDATATPATHELFQAAAGRGLRSGLVLPLRVDGSVIGALTLHSAEADAFDAREVALLSEMADDLSFGIATARLRERGRAAEVRLRHLAYFDAVTGLPNQASFVEHTTGVAAGSPGSLAVLVVQVQNYWEIAATLGQASGDEFLNDVARRLEALSPTLLARVAQSEFALLLSEADESAANREANRALASLAPPAQLVSISLDIQATIGIAVGGRRPGDAERLLQAAKLAAHEAGDGASRVLLAHPELDKEWRERLLLAGDLRAAIDMRTLQVHVQPQLDLRSGRICGMEALARWRRPLHGDVSPARFIGLAEKTGLIRPLTYAILDGVCDLAARHAAAGLLLPIAVNVSTRNLHDPQFVGRIKELLDRWPLPRNCLHLELTETAIMDDPVRSLKVLQDLHALGLPIYLDDFGTGYSSMAYLRELPLSGLKIDRAFTIGLAQPDTRRIVQTMIDLGHALGLKVVAEGTEDETTLAILADMGCDIAQGYGIARPMPNADMAAWIARWPGRRMPGASNGDASPGR
ncbi:MAG: EAL domain-containing protein [Immundisolibacter sp.]|uniref:bifunctional diguanylate cyclase/phosphodiesterase n=2 Tax=Immundisolibacter sp. TaxID=1934948 RepID=UPI0019C494F6|nr:EAL domain-containing protein [Immundisolibacter sp.]MBC7162280.1 EAL domain-containing protein [Immundisolibacter sp.]